jgi:hypothetical protein
VVQIVGFGDDAALVFANDFLSKDFATVGNALLVLVAADTRRGEMVDPQFVFDGITLDRQGAVGPVCAFEGRNLGGAEGLGVEFHRGIVKNFAGGTLSEVVGKLFLGHMDCLRHFVEDFLEHFANGRQADRDNFDVVVVGINNCSEPCEHELVPCHCILDGLMVSRSVRDWASLIANPGVAIVALIMLFMTLALRSRAALGVSVAMTGWGPTCRRAVIASLATARTKPYCSSVGFNIA